MTFATIRREVARIDAGLPIFEMRTMEEQVELSVADARALVPAWRAARVDPLSALREE
jgi:hypothetical protein